MQHPDIRVLLVTGGPAVVNEALRTPKKAITAGPGNPPAVVDQTADIDKAGRDIVTGASFDNNIVCVDEKTTIVVDTVADKLVRSMTDAGAYRLKEHELRRLERVIFKEMRGPNKPAAINPTWIGQDASAGLLAEIGVDADPDVRLLVAEVPAEHSLVWTEQMMPVMPVVRVTDVDAAIRSCGPVRARLPAHGIDPLHQRRDHHHDGPSHELLDPRCQRAKCGRARPGRRGFHLVLDRQPHR